MYVNNQIIAGSNIDYVIHGWSHMRPHVNGSFDLKKMNQNLSLNLFFKIKIFVFCFLYKKIDPLTSHVYKVAN